MIDGLSRLGAMIRVVLPLGISGILTVVVFAFTLTMHEFIYALTFISVSAKKTVSYRRAHGTGAGRRLPVGPADGRRPPGQHPRGRRLHLLPGPVYRRVHHGGREVALCFLLTGSNPLTYTLD